MQLKCKQQLLKEMTLQIWWQIKKKKKIPPPVYKKTHIPEKKKSKHVKILQCWTWEVFSEHWLIPIGADVQFVPITLNVAGLFDASRFNLTWFKRRCCNNTKTSAEESSVTFYPLRWCVSNLSLSDLKKPLQIEDYVMRSSITLCSGSPFSRKCSEQQDRK